MSTPSSKLLPLFLALFVLLIPLVSLVNNEFSIFTFKTISYLRNPNHSSNFSYIPYKIQHSKQNEGEKPGLWRKGFIGFKNNDDPSSINISRAVTLNISKCFPAELPPTAITSSNCCPPSPSSKFIDFKDFASPNATLRVRKPSHLVDDDYIAKLEKGIALMKALPEDDPSNFIQQAKVHCAYCNGAYRLTHPFQDTKFEIHNSWFFFPFHRWYIYFFERILGKLIGDPNFALSFWNWDAVEGMQMPSYFTNPNSSLYHELRSHEHVPPHVVDLNYNLVENNISSHQQVWYNLGFMYKQMVMANTAELFMGSPFRLGDSPFPGIGSIENAPHNTLHTWTGAADEPEREDMGTFYTAARDPIFYPHHANSDRLWGIWKTLGEEGRKDYSDDPDWLDSEFYFYDENSNFVRVKVRDCLDTKKLGYVYEDVDLPWLHTPPTSRKSKLLREGKKKGPLWSSKPSKFPLVLDSITSVIVKRPKRLRRKEEKEQEEEVLVIEGIEVGGDKFVKFDIHIDDDEDNLSGPDETEFVGTFVNMQHGHGHDIKTSFKLGISKVLENLEAQDDDDVLVTLVPQVGKGDAVIGSIKIEFMPKY